MKSVGPVSQSAKLILLFVLFAPTAFILLTYPVSQDGAFAKFLAVLVYAGCLSVIGWIASSLRGNPSPLIAGYGLFLFLLFFVSERVLGYAAEWLQLYWLAQRPWLIAVLSSAGAVASAAVFLPRMPGVMERSANLRSEHEKFIAAAECSLDDFYIFDGIPDASGKIVDFRFSYLNRNSERRLDRSRESLIGKVLTEVRPFMISSGLIEDYREVVRTGVPFIGEVFIDDEMIKATWINVQAVKLGDGLAITSRDITESKRVADRISHLAHYDQLTGLPNRTLLQDRLCTAILRAKRNGQKVAVFMLDIDQFKNINDTLGHADGDALLVAVSRRLRSTVRESDTIGRMGGDEFVIVMADFQSMDDVMRCGEQIVERVAKPISIGGHELNITVSIGVCIYPDSGLEAAQLLKNADAAMYMVKNSGRNGLHLFADGD